MAPIRLLIADDHTLFRHGLRHICEADGTCEVIGQARTGLEAVDLARRLQPDVILIDINMPELNGIQATRAICADDPDAAIIILTMYRQEGRVFEAIKAGSAGLSPQVRG